MASEEPALRANPGYALGQLARALTTSESHSDPEVRERARKKADAWTEVFSGMLSGALAVGSRTPLAETPGWATLEVATGGFATGGLLAGGPLRPHELTRLARLGHSELTKAEEARAALNASFLDEAGLAELTGLLRSGCYRIEVPEEGALLVVAWLLGHGYGDEARALLEKLGPFLSRLRFYPVPAERALTPSAMVHVQTIKETIERLDKVPENERALLQRQVLQVWNPLFDRLVALFAETVQGPMPAVAVGAGSEHIEGGWPCQHYAEDFTARAKQWLADYTRLRASHKPCRRLEHPTESGVRLRGYLARCVVAPHSLSDREVGDIRRMLALIAAARGLPGSPRCQALREVQLSHARLPTRRERARLLARRLAAYPQDAGLPALEPVLEPATEAEQEQTGYPAGRQLPGGLRTRLLRCLDAPVEELVANGAIPSGEVLAQVVPQLSAQVGAAGIADAELRGLYGAIYQAFRRRRSLLLLNLESQIRLPELPWVAAITRFRIEDAGTRASAKRTLTELSRLALTAFPQAILPNKLLQEVRALGDRAGVKMPIVEEVAADIFMGEFTEKYLLAAQLAATLLAGSLYELYYGISYAQVLELGAPPPPAAQGPAKGLSALWQRVVGQPESPLPVVKGPPRATGLFELCQQLAGEAVGGTRSVARNGRILEQEQILTTHNLATLMQALDLRELLQPELLELSRRCFTWICKEQQHSFSDWRLRLHMVKNTAYAWRQMIFFLSLAPPLEVEEFLHWATAHLQAQPQEFQQRFSPTLAGLSRAAAGASPGAARFLGWVRG